MPKTSRAEVDERIVEAVCFEHIRPAFQPIMKLTDVSVVGFEVLARWHDTALGQVPPDEFIPAVQAKSLLGIMTFNLIRAACRAASTWPGTFYLAFNVPPTLLQDRLSVDLLTDAIESTGFPFDRVRVEMTEAELIEDEPAAVSAVALLKSLGIGVALDDFGTGFSSMTRLHRFDFDEIKIDGSFVRMIEHDPGSRKIVSAIVGLGHSLDIPVVAESIQDQYQLDYLRQLGCNFGQGWLFGPAVPAEDAPGLLQSAATATRGRLGLSPYHRQHQLETLYAEAPVGLCFLDPQKRYLSANAHFCQMIGATAEAVIGKSIHEVYEPAFASIVEQTLDGLMQGAQSAPLEYQLPGRPQTYLAYSHRVLDDSGALLGLSIVSIDITARKMAEDALRQSEARYRHCVELSPMVMWVAEADGALSYISPLADEPVGCSMEQRLQAWYDRMNPQDRERVREQWLAWLACQQPFETRFQIQWKPGQWGWVLSRACPYIEEGQVVRWFGVFTDISQTHLLEARVEELEAQLRKQEPPLAPAP